MQMTMNFFICLDLPFAIRDQAKDTSTTYTFWTTVETVARQMVTCLRFTIDPLHAITAL
jgi:hypothetical protein